MNLESIWREKWKRGVLEAPQCDECGTWNWYPLPACRSCHRSVFTWKDIPLAGTLHSWTRVHRDFTGRGLQAPYLVGLADMAAAPGVRLPCRIQEIDGRDPTIGAKGSLTAVGDPDHWYWMFQPQGSG